MSPRGRGLLLHEQTHVLERANPALFEPLVHRRLRLHAHDARAHHAWLDAHVCANPDGPDLVWAFALEQVGGQRLGDALRDGARQAGAAHAGRLPGHRRGGGARTAAGWKVVERDGVPVRRDLDAIPGYHAHFPFPDEDFHPNEIAAVTLAHLLVHDVPDLDGRPLMAGVARGRAPRCAEARRQPAGWAAICRSACSNTSGGWPPEIRCLSSMMMAGTEWMPRCW